MRQHLNHARLKKLTENADISEIDVEDLFSGFMNEKGLPDHAPDEFCQIDPRDGTVVLFNSARAKRPHTYADTAHAESEPTVQSCPVCEGKTTGVVDRAKLSQGYTFINKNLFPIFFPPERIEPEYLQKAVTFDHPSRRRQTVYGLHLLQWTSSFHDVDWHNLPISDCAVVMDRMARLEGKLLFDSDKVMPPAGYGRNGVSTKGFVSIIKNFGKPVGGSLQHGHQQIAYSNVMPRRFYNNWSFYRRTSQVFSDFILRENPSNLLLKDYGEAVLLVPYFMKRPYDMLLLVKDTRKQYLAQLNEKELEAVAEGLHDAVWATLKIMPRVGKDTAFNITGNTGPGAGLYFEMLPYTQETGGFERLGLWVCQDSPENVAGILRETLGCT